MVSRHYLPGMDSPLPDSSALEAGIIEDARPSRISLVQDNVRHLLRNSVFGSVASSPTSPRLPRSVYSPTSPRTPTRPASRLPEVIPSPISPVSLASTEKPSDDEPESPHDIMMPPPAHNPAAHRSTLFNCRAIAALNHPDLSDLESLVEQKLKRSEHHSSSRSRKHRKHVVRRRKANAQGIFCCLAALLLAALVATYLTLALTSTSKLTPTFHILFILAILLATILFVHAAIRLCILGPRTKTRGLFIGVSHHGHHTRHHTHNRRRARGHHGSNSSSGATHFTHHHRPRRHRGTPYTTLPTIHADAEPYIPPSPIAVHLGAEISQPDQQTSTPNPSTPCEPTAQPTDADATIPRTNPSPQPIIPPPPAYGRWRGSVRADPNLLHWAAVLTPTVVDGHDDEVIGSGVDGARPSPSYEDIVGGMGPPSYVTRGSPARSRAGEEREEVEVGQAVRVWAVGEPEMVEVRKPGVGLAL